MLKCKLRQGASVLSLATIATGMFALTVQAQETPASEEAVQEVVVTGFRLQNRQAMVAKDNEERIAEFLTGDELGQQPDYNISDSFRRMPGVQTEFDEDEGRFVGIRGLDPNYTVGTLDGSMIATSERANRQLNMESIPSTAVKQLEVFKSRTPDMEGNAIGGTINLVTRSAFDKRGLYYVGSAFVGTSDSQKIPGDGFGRSGDDGLNFRMDGTISTTFGEAEQFGVLFTGAFSRKRRDQERFNGGAYTVYGGVPVTASHLWASYPNTVDRYGGTLKLEWRPSQTLKTALSGTYYVQSDEEVRHQHQLTRGSVNTASASGNSVRVNTAGGFVRFNDFPIEKPLTIIQASADWTPDDDNVLEMRLAYSEATFNEPSNQLQFNLPTAAANAYDYTFDNGVPKAVLVNPANFNDPSKYRFNSYNPYEDDSDEYITEAVIDWRRNMERGDTGWGFGAGAKTRELTRDFDKRQEIWGLASGASLTLADVLKPTDYTSINGNQPQMFIAFDKFLADKAANPSKYVLDTAATRLNAVQNDYVVVEQVDAAYLSARHAGERHSVIFGWRYEQTDTEISGYRVNENTSAITPLSRTASYGTWLPSVNFSYRILPNLRMRAAYYEAIGRANPSDLGTNERLNQTAFTVTRGNPDLKPREAKNYDISFDLFMPAKSGMISVAAFKKDIVNEIYSIDIGDTEIDGSVYAVSQPQNVATASVSGVEFSVVRNSFDFLPGVLKNVGASANYTRMHGKAVLPNGKITDRLSRQPDHQANAAVFYESGPLKLRLSYAYTGERYTSFSVSDPASNRYDKAYASVDFQGRFKFKRYQLIAEVRNLTDEHRENYDNYGARDLNYFGRQFWLGVAFKQ